MSDIAAIQITADRDSVCAGDDCDSHEAKFLVAATCSAQELLVVAWQACPLAGIAGGRATWLIDVASSENCIGVMAQQWLKPKLLVPPETTAAELFNGREQSLYFRYWCQSDPDAVLEAVRSGTPLPNRYS